jgi:hypothetical protein
MLKIPTDIFSASVKKRHNKAAADRRAARMAFGLIAKLIPRRSRLSGRPLARRCLAIHHEAGEHLQIGDV